MLAHGNSIYTNFVIYFSHYVVSFSLDLISNRQAILKK